MEEAEAQVVDTRAILLKDMALTPEDIPLETKNLETLRREILRVINYWLDNDMNSLLQALYRIDVPEHKVKEALAQPHPGQIGILLTELVIKRELQKVKLRKIYSS